MSRVAGKLRAVADKYALLVALLAGGISAVGFAPLHLWPVMLVMLALFIELLWHAPGRWRAFGLGYAFGFGQFTVGLNWIAHAFVYQDAMPHWLGWLAVPLLSLYLALYPALAALIGWQFGRARPGVFATVLGAGWVLSEYLRATLFTGFAWNPLGVIWLGTGVDQLAVVIGTYGLGFVAILAAGTLWWLAYRQYWRAGLFLGALVLIGVLGGMRASQIALDGAANPVASIHVVQPNINQNAKYDPTLEEKNFEQLAKLSGKPGGDARLIFWPEAAVPAILDMEPRWRDRIAALLGPNDLLMLGGDKYHFRQTREGIYTDDLIGANNSLWVLDAQGDLLDRYDKSHLVPFGEYLPMRPLLTKFGLSRLVPGSVDFWPGSGPRTLDLPPAGDRPALTMGVQICYEITFSGRIVNKAHRPDFIFNPSNDAWFGDWGPPQHVAQAQLRAIEEGLPIIRSTPTGISVLINPAGQELASIPLDHAGAFDALLPPALPATPFARWGNVLPLGLALVLLIGAVAFTRRSR